MNEILRILMTGAKSRVLPSKIYLKQTVFSRIPAVQPSVPVSTWILQLLKVDTSAKPSISKSGKLDTAFRASAISSNDQAMLPRSANSTRLPPTIYTMAPLSSNVKKAQKPAQLIAIRLEAPRPQSAPAFGQYQRQPKSGVLHEKSRV